MGGPLLADNYIRVEQERNAPAVVQPGKGGFADGAVVEIPRRRVDAANDAPGKAVMGEVGVAHVTIGDNDMQILREQVEASTPGKSGLGEVRINPSSASIHVLPSIDPRIIERIQEMLRQPAEFGPPGKGGMDGNRIDPGAAFPGKNIMTLEDVQPIGIGGRVDLSGAPGKSVLTMEDRQPIQALPGKVDFTPVTIAPPERQPIAIEVPSKGGMEAAGPARIEPTDTMPGKTPAVVDQDRVPVSVTPGKVTLTEPTNDNVTRLDPVNSNPGKAGLDAGSIKTPDANDWKKPIGSETVKILLESGIDISSSMSMGNGGGMASKLNVSLGGAPATPAAPATSALDDLAAGSGNGRFDQSVYERAKAAMKQSGPGSMT